MGLKDGKDVEPGLRETVSSIRNSVPQRRLYQKPAFRYERAFETMALSCGKTNSTQSQCRFNRKNS